MSENFRTNKTKAALISGHTINVAEVNRIFDPAVVEIIAQAGFGCAWIDMEHSHLDLVALSTMVLAARTVDLDVVVRIPKGPYNQVIKPFEVGANGLVWPHCKSADEAREFVQMAKFQPLGKRGVGGGRDSRYGTLDFNEYSERSNSETMLGVMIEDVEGVDDVEAIAAVEGIDLLFVGPSDLAHSYGVAHEGIHIEHERVQTAFDKVAAATAKHRKAMGTAVAPGESMRGVATKGGRWFNCSHELGALTAGYRDALQTTIAITGK